MSLPGEPVARESREEKEDAELAAALETYLEGADAGRPPASEELARAHPAVAHRIRACLDALRAVEDACGARPGPDAEHRSPGSNPEAEDPGGEKRLGDHRILREIGRGGMGIVFEAEQVSLRRRVAVKVLPFAGALDPKQLQRFQNEAQGAAQLHHPHIVPIHAVGFDQGLHYYSMQLIDGPTLADVIAGRPGSSKATPRHPAAAPDTFQRAARIGREAAEALAHAHQHGIIHRDVKPSNLLLDAQEKVWVTDFGLARFETKASLTLSGDVVGTIRYMSPEQALGKHGVIDHRTDIYSLGATLYELIAGGPAVDGADREEILRRLAFGEPRRLRQVNPSVPKDLETIVQKAMAHEPSDRYASAQELAGDLRRFETGLPITARPPSVADRCWRWSWRHRSLAASFIVFLLLAVVGLAVAAGAIWREEARTAAERLRAERNLARAREAVDRMLARVGSERLADVPQMELVRKELLEDALELYRGFAAEGGDHPEIRLETAQTHLRSGYLLEQLGRFDESLAAAQEAIRLAESVQGPAAQSMDARGIVGQANRFAGEILARCGRREEANRHLRRAVEVIEAARRAFPENPALGFDSAVARQLLAEGLDAAGDPSGARVEMKTAVDWLEDFTRRFPDRADHAAALAEAYASLGTLAERGGDAGRAVELSAKSRDVYLALPAEWQSRAIVRSNLSAVENRIGRLLAAAGDVARAESSYRAALDVSQKLAADFPHSAGHLESLLLVRLNLAALLYMSGRKTEARDAYLEAFDMSFDSLKALLALAQSQKAVPLGLHNLELLLEEAGNADELHRAFAELSATAGALAAHEEVDAGGLLTLLSVAARLSRLARARSVPIESGGLAQAIESFARGAPLNPERLGACGEAMASLERNDSAVPLLEAALRSSEGDAAARAPALATLLESCRDALRPDLVSMASVDAELERGRSIVPERAEWRFWRGRTEPSPSGSLDWTQLDFDDAGWSAGPSGFGYGDNDDATVLEDMKGAYSTVYIRRVFDVTEADRASHLVLAVKADDGFVAYLNGTEVARARAREPGRALPNDAVASAVAEEPIVEAVSLPDARLWRIGKNVLAVQGLNEKLDSSDFSLIPVVRSAADDSTSTRSSEADTSAPRVPAEERAAADRQRLAQFLALPASDERSKVVAYAEARLLERAGRRTEAVAELEKLVASHCNEPAPYLRLARSRMDSGELARAESLLAEAITNGVECPEVWALWLVAASRARDADPGRLLAAMPREASPEPEARHGPIASRARVDVRESLEALAGARAIRVNSGGKPYVSRNGARWSEDRCYRGGQRYFEHRGGDFLYEGEIAGTDDPFLYRSERWFYPEPAPSYRFFVPPGRYTVRLHFAEITYEKTATRVFDIALEGRVVLESFDPRAAGFATAQVKSFEVDVTDGCLEIDLVHRLENPKISAIEIVLPGG